MEEKTYSGSEAFRLMAETPGRAFTPVDSDIPGYKVFVISMKHGRWCRQEQRST